MKYSENIYFKKFIKEFAQKEIFAINDINFNPKYNFYHFIYSVFKILNPNVNFIHNKYIQFIHMVLVKMALNDLPDESLKIYKKYLINEIEDYDSKYVIFNLPPRQLKSTIISICWVAWLLGHKPSLKIIVASSSSRLAKTLGMQTRKIMETKFFQDLFPDCILTKKGNNSEIFYTTHYGYRLGCSLGQNIIGYGADYLIMDDPENPNQIENQGYREKTLEWFKSTFLSRLNNKNNSRIVLCTSRVHESDLTNYLINLKYKKKKTKRNNIKKKFYKTNFVSNYNIKYSISNINLNKKNIFIPLFDLMIIKNEIQINNYYHLKINFNI